MSKLNTIIYRKLQACIEEAKQQGLVKLAHNLEEAIGSEPAETLETYSYGQAEEDVHRELWKAAMHLIRYWNLDSVDVQKFDNSILVWASELIDEMEHSLGIDISAKSPLEPKTFGED